MRKNRTLLAALLISAVCAGEVVADPPFALPKHSELKKIQSAILYTERGDIYMELFPDDAPWHVANFKYLSDKGYYRNLRFHIHYPDYIIQGGAPPRNPNGGPGYTLPAEFSDKRHTAGVLGMARSPDDANPGRRSNGSQFHILLGDAPAMDGTFTIFGKVIKGMDVARSLRKGDLIKDIRVFVRR